MEDNRTDAARAVDEYQEKEMIAITEAQKSLANEFRAVASTHITFSVFTWTLGILSTIVIVAFSYVTSQVFSHEREDDTKFAKIEEQHQVFMNQNTQFQVTYAKIEVQLTQIQKEIVALGLALGTHDQK